MTAEEALKTKNFHLRLGCSFSVGPRGGIKEHHVVWHVTNVRRWKRDPERFALTVHRGLRGWDHLENHDFPREDLFSDETCPAAIASREYREKLKSELSRV